MRTSRARSAIRNSTKNLKASKARKFGKNLLEQSLRPHRIKLRNVPKARMSKLLMRSLLILAFGTFLSFIRWGLRDCSNKFFPNFLALEAFKFFVEFLIALLALEVLTNSNHVGFA